MTVLLDSREKHLRPIYMSLCFRDVVYDNELKQYVPGRIYSNEDLTGEKFLVKISFYEINEQYPVGSYNPFLSINADEIANEVVLNSRDVRNVKIVASGEWKKPGDKFLSIWSTSQQIDLWSAKEFNLILTMDQVSIGHEPLMAYARFSPVVEKDLEIPSNASLILELRRVDVGSVKLPGSVSISQRIILNEDVILEIPRGQWQYYIRVSEL